MPSNITKQSIYLGAGGTPETLNESTPYKSGELGARFTIAGKRYQIVDLDSGATASVGSGAPAANDLLFWKDKANYIVTHDIAQAFPAESTSQFAKRNAVAGVLCIAATAGNRIAMQARGRRNVASDGGGDFVVGDKAIAANTTTSVVDRMAAGTAPTNTVVGTVAVAESASVTALDLELPEVD